MTTKRKTARGKLAAREKETEQAVKFAVDLYSTTSEPPRQSFQLSPDSEGLDLSVDSLTRIAFIAGDLGCWLLARCERRKLPFDPEFNPVFFKALDYLDIEDPLLRKAYELELLESSR